MTMMSQPGLHKVVCTKWNTLWRLSNKGKNEFILGVPKDFQVALVRCLTAATSAVTLAFLFVEMLGRLQSSCVLCTKFGLLR